MGPVLNGLTPDAIFHGLVGVVFATSAIELGVAFLTRGSREGAGFEDQWGGSR